MREPLEDAQFSALLAATGEKVAAKNWMEAAQIWVRLVLGRPDRLGGYLGLAETLREARQMRVADEVLFAAAERFPLDPWPRSYLAVNAVVREDWPTADRLWATVRCLFPEHGPGYTRGAEALVRFGKVPEAEAMLTAAVDRFPQDADAAILFATIASEREDWAQALPRWRRAAALLPSHEGVLSRLDEALRHLSIQAARETAASGPAEISSAEHFTQQLSAAASTSNREALGRIVGAALRKYPDAAELYLAAAEAFFLIDLEAECDLVLLRAGTRFPNDSRYMTWLASLSAQRGNREQTASRLRSLLRSFPDKVGVVEALNDLVQGNSLPILQTFPPIKAVQPEVTDPTLLAAPLPEGAFEAELHTRLQAGEISACVALWHAQAVHGVRDHRFYAVSWRLLLALIRETPDAADVADICNALVAETPAPRLPWAPQVSLMLGELHLASYLTGSQAENVRQSLNTAAYQADRKTDLTAAIVRVQLNRSPDGTSSMSPAIFAELADMALTRHSAFNAALGVFANAALPRDIVGKYLTERSTSLGSTAFPAMCHDQIRLLMIAASAYCPQALGALEATARTMVGAAEADDGASELAALLVSRRCGDRPALDVPSASLRFAICVSGQLRGFREAFKTWRHLSLAGHTADFYVHSWQEIGRRQPENAVQAFKCFQGTLHATLLALSAEHGFDVVLDRFPALREWFRVGGTVEASALSALYGTKDVVLENDKAQPFAQMSNSEKMYYKIEQAHALMHRVQTPYDLVIRIRPDLALAADLPIDWQRIAAICADQQTIFSDFPPYIDPGLGYVVGDKFAVGSPVAMDRYARTWSFTRAARAHGHRTVPLGFMAHANLAYASFWGGIETCNLPELQMDNMLDAGPIDAKTAYSLISAARPESQRNNIDRAMLDAARVDCAA